jgi:hypothetical protein
MSHAPDDDPLDDPLDAEERARLPAGAHEEMLRWFSRRLDGELPEREAILLADHLDGCPRCALVASQLRAARRAIAADESVRSPVGLVERIVARASRAEPVAADAAPSRPALRFPVGILRASAALAAGLLLLVGGLYVAQGPKHAMAGASPTLRADPDLARVLGRWRAAHSSDPSLLELLLAPAPKER